MTKKKFLIVANTAHSLVNFRFHMLKELAVRGYEVVACAPLNDRERDSICRYLYDAGVRLIPIRLKSTGLNPFCDMLVFVKLIKLIKAENPDIVFSYTIKPVIYGSFAAKCARVETIYSGITGLGYVFICEDFKARILRFVVKKLYKWAFVYNTKVFFENQDDLNLFVTTNLLPKNKTVLTNGVGVDISKHVPFPFPLACTFFMAARLTRDKGICEYIDAVRILKKRYPKVRFLIAGDIDSNPASLTDGELNTLIKEGAVEYLGWVNDINKVFARTSVFVLPSYREGTSRAVLEAMASGRPIVTTDAPGCRAPVVDGVNGFLVPVKNIEALTIAMEKFILNPEIIVSMGKASRKIAEEKYDVEKVNKVILESMGIISG